MTSAVLGSFGECGTYQNTEEVKVLCRSGVVPTLVLELGVSVEGVQVLLSELWGGK